MPQRHLPLARYSPVRVLVDNDYVLRTGRHPVPAREPLRPRGPLAQAEGQVVRGRAGFALRPPVQATRKTVAASLRKDSFTG
jgi:hypothetical protein